MKYVSIWAMLWVSAVHTAGYAGESNEKYLEEISVRPSLAVHLGLTKQDVVFGQPRQFTTKAFDSAFELEPMDATELATMDEDGDALNAGR